MIRAVAVVMLLVGIATVPAAAGITAPRYPVTGTTDHGCSLYVGIPNPCDPDSAN